MTNIESNRKKKKQIKYLFIDFELILKQWDRWYENIK